jgi:hypothetical protein
MACKEDRYPLGDRAYFIRQMPPRLAFKVEVWLAKTIGQPLFKAFASDELTVEAAFGLALGLFAERIDDDSALRMMHHIFRYVGIDGVCVRICEEVSSDGIDTHFQGRNKELLQVFAQALKVNFKDFFAELPSISSLLSKFQGRNSSGSQTLTSGSSDPLSQNLPSTESKTSTPVPSP